MEDAQSDCAMTDDLSDSNMVNPDIDSGYGESSSQSMKTTDGNSCQQSGTGGASTASAECSQPRAPSVPGSTHPERVSLRPILKSVDEQTSKRACDVIEQMSELLQEHLASSKRRKLLPRSKKEPPSMSIRAIMLGTTIEDAKVCLVIFCTDVDGIHDKIRKFLRKSVVKELYRPVDTAVPSFDVHILGASPNTRAGIEVGILAEGRFSDPSISTLCGMPVWLIGGNRLGHEVSVTMGGILEIEMVFSDPGSKRAYGITVVHDATDSRNADDGDLWISDSVNEYDSSPPSSTTSNDSGHCPPIEIDWVLTENEVLEHSLKPFGPLLEAPSDIPTCSIAYSALGNGKPFRDWALFEFPAERFAPKPNMLQIGERQPQLLKAPTSLATTSISRPVSIITRSAEIKKATLSPSLSRILLKPGAEFVRAFSVELNKNSDIVQGDSGSWVVDSSTFEVYGHLVATDMLLGSYVIPLIDIFTDIKDQVAVASIGFPNPSQPVTQTPSYVPLSPNCEVENNGGEGSSIAKVSSVFSPRWTISTLAATSSTESSAGRRQLWLNSERRKLARVYVYTTLPLEMIIAVLYPHKDGLVPGLESSFEILKSILDKQPRWLRPRTEDDMTARLRKLTQSPFRKAKARHQSNDVSYESRYTEELQSGLPEYSAAYVDSIEMLMECSVGTIDDDLDEMELAMAESTRGSWLQDKDAPTVVSPPPIPEDFLHLDELLVAQGYCGPGLSTHDTRSCLCFVRDEASIEDFVTESGPTAMGLDVLEVFNPTARVVDSFGNTALHLLAARHPDHSSLLRAVKSAPSRELNSLNAAKQGFLHVLGPMWFVDVGTEESMLSTLLKQLPEYPIYVRDTYGRSFFHVLQISTRDRETIKDVLGHYDLHRFARRDAFGVIPTGVIENATSPFFRRQIENPTELDDPQIAINTQILSLINDARHNPSLEDSNGRNGLHLIADAVLSVDTLIDNLNPKRDTKTLGGSRDDSSTDRLLLRQEIVEGLLNAGVDVNHYNRDGNTVLMSFVARLPEDDDFIRQCRIFKMLIERGAYVDARNRWGETALHIAVRTGRKLATRTLVEAGANVHVRDGEGRSVLDVADIKILHAKDVKKYAHFEAIRAWLSGTTANAVQDPSVKQEWALPKET